MNSAKIPMQSQVIDFHNHHMPAAYEAQVVRAAPANQRARWELLARRLTDEDFLLKDIREGVAWRDPERVGEWMGELKKDEPVVVYCAYGFHVGCRTAIALRDAGFDARYMKVGHSGWKAIGAPVKMHA